MESENVNASLLELSSAICELNNNAQLPITAERRTIGFSLEDDSLAFTVEEESGESFVVDFHIDGLVLTHNLHRESFSNFKSACFTPTTESDDNGETLLPGIPVFNGHKTWNEPFRRAMKLKVPYRKYLNMLSLAGDKATNPPEYIAATYNCQSFVNEILAAGGVVLGKELGSGNVFSYAGGLVPNVVFDGADFNGTTGVLSLEKITF